MLPLISQQCEVGLALRKEAKRPITRLAESLGILSIIFVMGTLPGLGNRSWEEFGKQEPFDSRTWMAERTRLGLAARRHMLKELIEKHKLIGLSKKQLIGLLGYPDEERPYFSYRVFVPNEPDMCVELEFAMSRGVVSKYRLVNPCSPVSKTTPAAEGHWTVDTLPAHVNHSKNEKGKQRAPSGDGRDTIVEGGNTWPLTNSGIDTIRLGQGISVADLRFSATNNDLIISFANSSDRIVVKGQYTGDLSKLVERLEFADGSWLSAAQIEQLVRILGAADQFNHKPD